LLYLDPSIIANKHLFFPFCRNISIIPSSRISKQLLAIQFLVSNIWYPDPASIPFPITGNSWFSFNFSILAGATSSDKPIMQGGYFQHSPSTYLHYDMMAVMVALHQIIKLTPTQPKSET
jgi:hypothetical protein